MNDEALRHNLQLSYAHVLKVLCGLHHAWAHKCIMTNKRAFSSRRQPCPFLSPSSPADVFCVSCANCVGWRYEFAFEKSQKYKENKVL